MLNRRDFALSATALAIGAQTPARANELPYDMTIGAADAPIHLFEYASATCPHCAHFHETNWALLQTRYIDTGHVRFTMREMATPPAAVALAMFQLARCGGADATEYFRRLAILFERQRAILATGTMEGVRNALVELGGEWGLSAAQVGASLTDQQGVDRLTLSIRAAYERGVTGTPTFFIGEERINDPAFLTPEGMAQVLDARLAR